MLVPAGDRGVGEAASRQHDCVTTAQLEELGVHRNAIAHRVRTGRLHPLDRGVFLVGRPHPTPLTTIAAALLATAPALASHRTATYLWTLLPTQPRFPPEITVAHDRRPARSGIVVHRVSTPPDLRLRHGLPVTSPARTLLDLAAVAPAHELARAVAEAHVKGLARREELDAVLGTGRPGTRALRTVLEAQLHRTRSRPERDLIALCGETTAGSPAPAR